MTEGAFFQDLAVLMAAAGAVAVIFGKLRWPKVIGYLLAGVVLSENTWGGAWLSDAASVRTIGQLGIAFLMLTLGLEFSASSIRKVKGTAGPMAAVDTLVMIWIGYTAGRNFLGWSNLQSLFLGAAICDSATTLLAKTIDEMKWSKRPFVRYVISTSVLEDVICVGVIALITGVATGSGMSFGAVGMKLGGLAVFFVCVLVFGLILVPRLLDTVAKGGSDESLLLTFLGCCFFVSWMAYKLDYSMALGAFLVGVLGACSAARQRLLKLADPLRSMFAAVFFVTIGYLVDPEECWENIVPILLLSAVVMVGKGMNCFTVSLLTGQTPKTAVQTAFGLAQIGEFAYMVAMLYAGLADDASTPMFQIVVGVSLLTTCLNPLMLKISDPVGDRLERMMPEIAKRWLGQYNIWLERFRVATMPGELHARIRSRCVWLVVTWVLIFAVSVMATALISCDWKRFSEFFNIHKGAFFGLAANVFFAAMLAPAWGAGKRLGDDIGEVVASNVAVRRAIRFAFIAAAMTVTLGEVVMLNVNLMPKEPKVQIGMMVVLVVICVVWWKKMKAAVKTAGVRFTEALEAEEAMTGRPAPMTFTMPGDNFLEVKLDETSPAVGLSIVALNVRAKTGASIVSVARDGTMRRNPDATWVFEAGDTVEAIGSPKELAAFKDLFGIVGGRE